MKQNRIVDYGIEVGRLPKGKRNKITDVDGVTVGHYTVDDGIHQTGITVVMPCKDNPFINKITAASYVINGFGKTTGLIQIDELGVMESPIFLTNTLNVGLVFDAAVSHMIKECNAIDVQLSSYNPIVCECNDGFLNDIQSRVINEEKVFRAIETASVDFVEGSVGAGRGMSCHHLKGGIGSASRIVTVFDVQYTIGVMVLSNHGKLEDFVCGGKPIGASIKAMNGAESESEKGSIIIIMATDMPLSDRQIKRMLKRVPIGLSKTGSFIGHGSGEVAIGFTTANRVSNEGMNTFQSVSDNQLDIAFQAIAEAVEESVLNSMITAESVVGAYGNERKSLSLYEKIM